MGGRGGSSATAANAWRKQTVYEQAVAIATEAFDKTHPDGAVSVGSAIPDWVIDKKLDQGAAFAFRNGDGAFIKRETEKAYLIANDSDYGQVSFWMPKSWMSTPEKVRSDTIAREVGLHVGSNYNKYLRQTAADAGLKVGNLKTTAKLAAKLQSKDVGFMTKEDFKGSKGFRVLPSWFVF